jgi:hypothetical protein
MPPSPTFNLVEEAVYSDHTIANPGSKTARRLSILFLERVKIYFF